MIIVWLIAYCVRKPTVTAKRGGQLETTKETTARVSSTSKALLFLRKQLVSCV